VKREIWQSVDWAKLAPLRLRARLVAEGAYAGMHQSPRRGAGIEFGGHRAYTPGDDLRFIDRHALMRHGELMIREFETETDRDLRLILDASPSMAHRSARAPASKLDFASLVAAALAKIAVDGGDRVGLGWLGGKPARALPAMGGHDAFERLTSAIEETSAAEIGERALEQAVSPAERSRRGAVIAMFSDLLDVPAGTAERVAALAARRRVVVVVQVLDPEELEFPFRGPVRLTALEGSLVVDTDADTARERYLAALADLQRDWEQKLARHGGRLVLASSAEDPVAVLLRVLGAAAGGRA
jgi:uncharacterized protein (DUF58 family)